MPEQTLPDGMKLNVGCGQFPMPGTDWINVDCDPEVEQFVAKLDGEYHFRLAQAHELDFLEDGSIALVYASHVLEHYAGNLASQSFGKPLVKEALAEWHRVLVPDGLLWLAVPDLEQVCNRILSEARERANWIAFLYGHQQGPNDVHHWGWTKATFGAMLVDAGFWPRGQFEPFVRSPDGEGFDCAAAWVADDWGNECRCSMNVRAKRRTQIGEEVAGA